MTNELATDFGGLIAKAIKANSREIARRWLDQLADLVPVEPSDVFPTDKLLDHVPVLIHEIADYVSSGQSDAIAANTMVFEKARELGELRFAQKASVHQLLREYRILAGVLGAFVREQFDLLGPSGASSSDVIALVNRLNEAVFVLLQATVDTFVGRYTSVLEEQTTRLEGFNRMVSHELRQPLASVQYAVDLLRQLNPADEEQRARCLELADRNARRLSQLLGMLGALARPDQDNLQLQTIDVAKVLGEVGRQLREMADAKGVTFRTNVGASTLTVDIGRLEMVLLNLVSNAIKYRDPSKPDAFVEVSCHVEDGQCRFLVADNGLGIPSEDHPKIFRRFYRAHAARDAELQNDGVGLGLAIAAECAKSMHGALSFESVEGIGTTFTLTLPEHPDAPT